MLPTQAAELVGRSNSTSSSSRERDRFAAVNQSHLNAQRLVPLCWRAIRALSTHLGKTDVVVRGHSRSEDPSTSGSRLILSLVAVRR